MSSSDPIVNGTQSDEKERIIEEIISQYEKLLDLTHQSNQIREQNDYIQKETLIYKNYLTNLEERIQEFADK